MDKRLGNRFHLALSLNMLRSLDTMVNESGYLHANTKEKSPIYKAKEAC